MIKQTNNVAFSQRQLRVGELIKRSLGQIFLKDEAKVPVLETKNITVTEVRMSPDLKNARAYVIPLGGKNTDKAVSILTEFSHLIRTIFFNDIHRESNCNHGNSQRNYGKNVWICLRCLCIFFRTIS